MKQEFGLQDALLDPQGAVCIKVTRLAIEHLEAPKGHAAIHGAILFVRDEAETPCPTGALVHHDLHIVQYPCVRAGTRVGAERGSWANSGRTRTWPSAIAPN